MGFSSDRRALNIIVNSLSKWQVKLIFALLAFSIIVAVIMFTQSLVEELIKREQQAVELFAKVTEDFLDMVETPTSSTDTDIYIFFIDEIQNAMINFPIVVTYENGEPYEPFEDWSLNIEFAPEMSIAEKRALVINILKKMETTYEPILVTDKDGKVISKVFYTHSALVDKLRFFPYIAIIIVAVFVIIGYISFNSSRDNEQSKVWVGMSKEAAHQLGTPLSSLLAWLEIIKFSADDPKSVLETTSEMEKDIQRLNTIATRFSKIGSTPEKENVNLSKLIDNVCNYFDKRLPHLGKKIEIIRSLDDRMFADVNVDLFAWVIENLLKNGAEAIEEKQGQIYIFMRVNPKKKIYIFVKDTGKGMTPKLKRQIFNPGFSTKRRGWGLGLSLCKRIIEEYHDGKIYVKETMPGKGTTFAIELPLKE
ncbi:MAG: HAMP domain-containing histidine kinase [Candidatus Kapabacteria bacterium]|nr:HAMP domain-containing histidine kinase [Ignavibacteriota bacterium]MCW5886368.1 HAMP domain-containing histidine kinase [Candidatus Kapabacteria bacterium]